MRNFSETKLYKMWQQTFYVPKLSSENAIKYGTAGQATDTHSGFAFHDIIGFANGLQCYVLTHFTYLVIYEA
jgi:hypothetical protein